VPAGTLRRSVLIFRASAVPSRSHSQLPPYDFAVVGSELDRVDCVFGADWQFYGEVEPRSGQMRSLDRP